MWDLTKDIKHVAKILDLKFFECPVSVITKKTWDIIKLVNETTDENGKIIHLPFNGSYLDQPPWYREAVIIVRTVRNKYRKELNAKSRQKNAGRNYRKG